MNQIVIEVLRAAEFAAVKHAAQHRKGESQEPYVNHLLEVARLLAEATDGEDATLIVAGLLHDTVEDVGITYDDLVQEFGTDVADLVLEVTDDKSLPKAERKQLQEVNAPHKSDRAKMIKMADKTSNLRAIVTSPPVSWSVERKREYFAWAGRVVAGCRGVNPYLESVFDTAYSSFSSEP